MKTTAGTYNGWANYETWNVTLWLGNDADLYDFARLWVKRGGSYATLAHVFADMGNAATPDGVAWADAKLDVAAIDDFLSELKK